MNNLSWKCCAAISIKRARRVSASVSQWVCHERFFWQSFSWTFRAKVFECIKETFFKTNFPVKPQICRCSSTDNFDNFPSFENIFEETHAALPNAQCSSMASSSSIKLRRNWRKVVWNMENYSNGKLCGLISSRNFLSKNLKKVSTRSIIILEKRRNGKAWKACTNKWAFKKERKIAEETLISLIRKSSGIVHKYHSKKMGC